MTEPTLTILGATIKDGEVRLQYQAVNPAGAGRIFLFNLYEDNWGQLNPPPRQKFSAQVAPAWYHEEQGVLAFLAGEVPAPANPNVSMFMKRLPKYAPLAGGETFDATIRAVLPLAEWSPYSQPVRSGPVREVQAHRVRVILAYVIESEAWAPARPFKAQPGAFEIGGMAKFVRAESPSPIPIPVLLRTDPFRRYGQ